MTTIMVVEDESLVAKDLASTLQRLGYDVTATAGTGNDALRKAETCRPDMVLMDINLRGDLDGIATAGLLRDRMSIPSVFLTAYADEGTVARARETEPLGYLLKPFNEREIRTTLEIAVYKHHAETRLRERERWLATTLRSIGDGVLTTDPEGRVTFLNPVAERLTGVSPAEGVGRLCDEVVRLTQDVGGGPVALAIHSALRDRTKVELARSALLVARSGTPCPVEHSAAPILTDDGKLLGAVLILRDIGERQRIAQHLARCDRMIAIGTMAEGVAHEINNPLTSVIANVGFAGREIEGVMGALRSLDGASSAAVRPLLVEATTALDEAAAGAERVRKIVADLQVFARPEERAPAPLNLWQPIETAIVLCTPHVRHRARIVRECGPAPAVRATPSRIEQLVVNLIMNAVQALPDGRPDEHQIVITTRTDAVGRAVLEVADDGVSLSDTEASRIFDPFFPARSTDLGGGLGLSICFTIVRDLGGDIAAERDAEKGNVFRAALPPSVPPPPLPTTDPPPVAAGLSKARILVVDDEPLLLSLMRRVLQSEHEVVIVDRARAALERISHGERFAAVLCDLMMPEMNGMELYEQVRTLAPEQADRFAFMCGGAVTDAANDFLDAHATRRIDKPMNVNQLRSFVANFVRNRG